MRYVERNLPVETGLGAAMTVRARVTSVDARRRVVTVSTVHDGRIYTDVPIASPYQHYRGEGLRFVPDIDAICMLHFPSDDTPPYIQAFLDVPSMVTQQELESGSSTPDQPVHEEEGQMSYAGAAPESLPGEVFLSTRDGNFLNLRRGGVVETGATALCQRVMNPVTNTIQDYAENYELLSVPATLAVRTDRAEDSTGGEAGGRVQLLANDLAADAAASVSLEIGRVDEQTRLRLVISPRGISHDTGEYSAAKLEITIAESGAVALSSVENVNVQAAGLKLSSEGDCEVTAGGSHKLTATSSLEQLSGAKTISAQSINLAGPVAATGGFMAPGTPLLGNLELLYAWLASHQHTPGGPPPVSPPPR